MYINKISFNINCKNSNYSGTYNLKNSFNNIKFCGKGDVFSNTNQIKIVQTDLNKKIKQLPLEDLFNVDFNEIYGEVVSKGLKIIKDVNRKTIRILKARENNKQIWTAIDIDPDTGNKTQSISFNPDNTILNTFYDKKDRKIASIFTRSDGTKIERAIDYDEKTGEPFKQSKVINGEKFTELIWEYDSQTGKLIKENYFREDGKTLDYIREFNPETEELIKEHHFYHNGTLNFIKEYDPKTGNILRKLHFNYYNKTLDRISEYDVQTRNLIKESDFYDDGITLSHVNEYDLKTENLIKEYSFNHAGELDFIKEYDIKTGNLVRKLLFDYNGKTIA